MDIGQYGLVAVIRWDFLLIHWNLGDLGPLLAPLLHHLRFLDCLTFFIFFLDCSAFRDNHVCCCVLHDYGSCIFALQG